MGWFLRRGYLCRRGSFLVVKEEKPGWFTYIIVLLLAWAKSQRGSCMAWEINMGVCPRLEFDNIMFINCLGYDFYIYGVFEFLCNSIANLWRHV